MHLGTSRYIRANSLYTGNSCCYLGNVVVFGKVVGFGQKWLYSAKVAVFVQQLMYSGKVVVFGQKYCIRANWLYSGKSGCIRAK